MKKNVIDEFDVSGKNLMLLEGSRGTIEHINENNKSFILKTDTGMKEINCERLHITRYFQVGEYVELLDVYNKDKNLLAENCLLKNTDNKPIVNPKTNEQVSVIVLNQEYMYSLFDSLFFKTMREKVMISILYAVFIVGFYLICASILRLSVLQYFYSYDAGFIENLMLHFFYGVDLVPLTELWVVCSVPLLLVVKFLSGRQTEVSQFESFDKKINKLYKTPRPVINKVIDIDDSLVFRNERFTAVFSETKTYKDIRIDNIETTTETYVDKLEKEEVYGSTVYLTYDKKLKSVDFKTSSYFTLIDDKDVSKRVGTLALNLCSPEKTLNYYDLKGDKGTNLKNFLVERNGVFSALYAGGSNGNSQHKNYGLNLSNDLGYKAKGLLPKIKFLWIFLLFIAMTGVAIFTGQSMISYQTALMVFGVLGIARLATYCHQSIYMLNYNAELIRFMHKIRSFTKKQ